MYDIEEYSFRLPPRLIAQVPAQRRDASRLMVANRKTKSFSDRHFFDLPGILRPGDLIIVNDTRVVPARLFGRKASGGKVEILVLDHEPPYRDGPMTRLCLLKSSKRPKKGGLLLFDSDVKGRVKETLGNGLVKITFECDGSFDALLEEIGHMPLPQYIKRGKKHPFAELDRERYQTVFAKSRGAVAAPTAGLHFSRKLLDRLRRGGVAVTALTLHVGYGTFRAVRTKDIRKHRLEEEYYHIEPETAKSIERTREAGGRLIAVGTTVVRALESEGNDDGTVRPGEGKTDLCITPGFSFKVVDAMITNFHLPKSSLLFLAVAFAGMEIIKAAYARAIKREYRFFSYGDSMLIL